MRIVAVGQSETVIGFQLAGIKDVYEVNDEWEAENVLREIKDMPDVAIVILPRGIANKIRKFLNDWKMEKGIYPVILEIPDVQEEEKYEDPMRSLIRRAIGVDIYNKR